MAHGQPITVIAHDFTRSTVVAHSADGETEHHKNLNATGKLLARLPADTQFSVIGITEASFSNPLLILSGQIPVDPGPLEFVNRSELVRTRYVKQFKAAAEQIRVTAQKTDVIGAFFIASEILKKGSGGKRNLIVVSDMRQSAVPLDIETPK